jgi:hypothetical protein
MSVLSSLQSLNIKLCSDLSQIDCSIFRPTPGSSSALPALVTQKRVLSSLHSVSFKLCSDLSQIDCSIFHPTPGSSLAPPALVTQANPLVSCLMMTRGNIELMRYSLACYQRQTYANRELVVVAEPEAGEKVRAFIALHENLNVTVFVAPPGLTLGDHRNLAAARARGAILVTWDDDDLSDPRRLDIAIRVLRQTGAAAAFLARLLVWWPQRKVAAISRRRLWEQSIAAWRSYMPIYAPLPRGEDSVAINRFISTHDVAQVDCPFLYVYAVTGRNTSNARHFERILSTAECLFEGDQFDELNEHLSDRLPVLNYAALLKDEG